MTDLLATVTEARERFMELVAEVRPELHRYYVPYIALDASFKVAGAFSGL